MKWLFIDGWTTDDLVFLWKEGDPVQVVKNLHLPRFTLEKFLTDYCNSKTNTGNYSNFISFFLLGASGLATSSKFLALQCKNFYRDFRTSLVICYVIRVVCSTCMFTNSEVVTPYGCIEYSKGSFFLFYVLCSLNEVLQQSAEWVWNGKIDR